MENLNLEIGKKYLDCHGNVWEVHSKVLDKFVIVQPNPIGSTAYIVDSYGRRQNSVWITFLTKEYVEPKTFEYWMVVYKPVDNVLQYVYSAKLNNSEETKKYVKYINNGGHYKVVAVKKILVKEGENDVE